MFSLSRSAIQDLDAGQLHKALAVTEVLLVDVREPDEHRNERIAGAVNMPLSRFDPAALPPSAGKTVVLHCQGGVRSAKALEACQKAGVEVRHHLKGGINAWKAAGLPILR